MIAANHYAILDVSFDATAEEIRTAYHLSARRYHPDSSQTSGTSELFFKSQQAYDILSIPEKRASYDETLPKEEISTPGFAFKSLFSRTKIAPGDEKQLVYVLLDINAKIIPGKKAQRPVNLTLVLDRSTSMQGERMDMVKDNAIRLLRQSSKEDIVSIVTFSDRAEVLIPPTRLTDLPVIESKISRITTGGSTEIFQGLSTGIAQVRQNTRPSYLNHLILLTDGRTYGDEDSCIGLGKEVAEEGIGISALGIGDEWNDEFLDNLAATTGGVSMFISAPTDLRRFLDQKYRNLEQVYGEQVTFTFTQDDSARLNYAFRIYPEPAPLSIETPVHMGNIQSGTKLVVILEFCVTNIAKKAKEVLLAEGKLNVTIPTRIIPRTRLPFRLACNIIEGAEAQPAMPSPIVHALSQLNLYRMQEKAQEELKKGDTVKASRHLQYLATHLLAKGERELAHTVLKEADHIQRKKKFSEEGDKRIKYGTRSLMLPPGPDTETK